MQYCWNESQDHILLQFRSWQHFRANVSKLWDLVPGNRRSLLPVCVIFNVAFEASSWLSLVCKRDLPAQESGMFAMQLCEPALRWSFFKYLFQAVFKAGYCPPLLDSQDKYVMRKQQVRTACFLTMLISSHHFLPADGEVMWASTFSLFFWEEFI